MAIVGLSRQSYVDESVAEAVALAGGLDFISQEDNVLVKPNVNNDKPAPSTISQEVVGEAVELCLNQRPLKVKVADRSNYNYKTIEAMKKTGMFHAAIEAGAEIVDYDNGPWERIYNDDAELWSDGIEAPSFINEIDKIINLCLCKTHRIAGFSGALLNMVGLISVKDRISHLHRTHEEPYFSERVAELGLFFKSDFTIMDATSVFLNEGPESGLFAHPGIIIASDDPVAADLAGTALLKLLGADGFLQKNSVWEAPQIKSSIKLGIGPKSPTEITIKGNIEEIEAIRGFIDQQKQAA